MFNYIDLNLQNPKLADDAKKLGFSQVKTARILLLENGKDLNLANGKELMTVESADPELLRNCIKQKKPILCNPLLSKDFYRDDGLIREAAERETVFEIPISEFLKSNFVFRAKLINNARKFIKKCLKLKASFVFTSRAENELELKSPREIIAIASTLFDLTTEQAQFAISRRAEKVIRTIG
ncbi:MAG: RNase P subunit p30 family protein [Candidatus Micrarchaeota archaeon]